MKTRPIVIIGSNGQLGSDLAREWEGSDCICLNHNDLEISNLDQVRSRLTSINPSVICNTASFHNVPHCEEEPLRALQVNVLGARNLAQVARDLDTRLVHFSTDYVFDGKKKVPYVEEDLPHPLNFYGVSKLAGEQTILAVWEEHCVVRVSGIYGKVPCRAKGTNFVKMMLDLASNRDELQVVQDEILTPTYTVDIARQVKTIVKNKMKGIVHVSNSGQCSWYDFACKIFEIKENPIRVTPVPATQFPSPVARPAYSVLANKKLKEAGIYGMPDWEDALKRHLQTL